MLVTCRAARLVGITYVNLTTCCVASHDVAHPGVPPLPRLMPRHRDSQLHLVTSPVGSGCTSLSREKPVKPSDAQLQLSSTWQKDRDAVELTDLDAACDLQLHGRVGPDDDRIEAEREHEVDLT
eukprot:768443-Hanusia_phi.AAC.1